MNLQAVIDVESVPLPEDQIRALAPVFDPDKVKLGNRSKPDVIAAFLKQAEEDHEKDIMERAALDPRYGRVAVAGLLLAKGDVTEILPITAEGDERRLLEALWARLTRFWGVDDGQFVIGYNVKWDIRFCVRRSWVHGVQVPRQVFNPFNRFPFGPAIIDLQEVLAMGDYGKAHESLDDALRSFGLPPKTGKGKDFPALWEKDRAAALAYNAADVRSEHALAKRIGVI